MESVQIIGSILIELLSKVCLQVTAPPEERLFEYPPSKKLRMAKSTSNATEIQPKSIDSSKSHQFNNPIQESKSNATRTPVNSAPATLPATRPKFDVARKLSELKADRDHWKHLCLSSRLQVTTRPNHRAEIHPSILAELSNG